VQQLDPEQLVQPFGKDGGRYNLEFAFDPNTNLFNIKTLSGITVASPPPKSAARVWDFRKCGTNMPGDWQADHAVAECAGKYLDVKASTIDPNLLLTGLNIDLTGKSWLRLGVSAKYQALDALKRGEWFWEADSSNTWLQANSRSYILDSTGSERVYWTFIRVQDLGSRLSALRFDPINDGLDSRLSWISVDIR
jgi:hypothetical protein